MKLTPRIKIVIADDHELFRHGFKQIIQHEYSNELEFVGEASNGAGLVDVVERCAPSIAITDIQMPGMNGIDACQTIKKKFPQTSVIAFSMFTDTNTVMQMIRAGADGYLVKSSEKEEIIEAIRTVHQQTRYYCSTISSKIYGKLANSNQRRRQQEPAHLGSQEKAVIQLMCRQLSTKEIAAEMQLAPKTVEHYREKILEKTGARNSVGIALYAVVHELINLNTTC